MRKYKAVPTTYDELQSIVCDSCKTEYDDIWEIEETFQISFIAGYGSIFGDGTTIKLDICQHCLKGIITPMLQHE